jgi:membrane associated rhomboid family serine protease
MRGSRSWLVLCMLHGVASMVLWWSQESAVQALIWRSAEWRGEAWTLWTSAWVHLNTPHLVGNQLALGALTAAGWWLRPTRAATLAWCLSWPLMQLSLVLWPLIGYAVGLSGVLHAGVAVLAAQLLVSGPRALRPWGLLLAAGLLLKLWLEQGWSTPVVWDPGNQMSVVQAAHLSGAAWGALFGTLGALWTRWRDGRAGG